MGLLSALFSRKPRTLLEQVQANPIFQQYKALADAMEPLCASGVDADELPNGRGEFGLTATNPVPCKTVLGATAYMGRLRTPDGMKVLYERLGSVQSDVTPMPIDVYEVRHPNGAPLGQVFVSAYHQRISGRAPKGFRLADHAFANVRGDSEAIAPVSRTVRTTFALPARTLKYLVSMVQFAMGEQDPRHYLNGMLLAIDTATVRAVATDGHRLALCDAQREGTGASIEAIIPRKTIIELARLLPDDDEHVRLEITAEQITFCFGEIELSSKLLEGRFPNYEAVIPRFFSDTCVVDREEMIRTLELAASPVTGKVKRVQLALAPGLLKVKSDDIERGEFAIDYAGTGLEVAFNANYLLDVLRSVNSEKLKVEFGKPSGAALITPPDSGKFKCVIMPMR